MRRLGALGHTTTTRPTSPADTSNPSQTRYGRSRPRSAGRRGPGCDGGRCQGGARAECGACRGGGGGRERVSTAWGLRVWWVVLGWWSVGWEFRSNRIVELARARRVVGRRAGCAFVPRTGRGWCLKLERHVRKLPGPYLSPFRPVSTPCNPTPTPGQRPHWLPPPPLPPRPPLPPGPTPWRPRWPPWRRRSAVCAAGWGLAVPVRPISSSSTVRTSLCGCRWGGGWWV